MSKDETLNVSVSATTEVDLGCRVAAYLNKRVESDLRRLKRNVDAVELTPLSS